MRIPNYTLFNRHLWADYFELLCLIDPDKFLGIGQIKDRIKLQLEEGEIDFSYYREIINELDENNSKFFVEILEKFSLDILKIIRYRKKLYNDFYPFLVRDNSFESSGYLNDEQVLYVYFLMCSHLRWFMDSKYFLTTDFECFSQTCLKNYLGNKFCVHVFGKNAHQSSVFSGNKFSKLQILSNLFNERLIAKETDFPQHDNGDEGIDLIAYAVIDDRLPGNLLITAQCKCQDDWYDFRFSSSSTALSGMMTLTHPNANFAFIPICFRNEDGDWFQKHKTSGVILMDRKRMISLIENHMQIFKQSESYNRVWELLKKREEVV